MNKKLLMIAGIMILLLLNAIKWAIDYFSVANQAYSAEHSVENSELDKLISQVLFLSQTVSNIGETDIFYGTEASSSKAAEKELTTKEVRPDPVPVEQIPVEELKLPESIVEESLQTVTTADNLNEITLLGTVGNGQDGSALISYQSTVKIYKKGDELGSTYKIIEIGPQQIQIEKILQ